MGITKFEKSFLLGAATAAHQVEGNNTCCDFWAMENEPGSMFTEPSGEAVDHYRRYKEDIDLLADAGLNAYRFSIEWARIEPAEGCFNQQEVLHYRDVLEYCHVKGVEPIVTMHHFTSPQWVVADGGWENEAIIDRFARYCTHIAKELGSLMRYVCTINEANMGLQITKIIKDMMAKMGALQVGANIDALKKHKQVNHFLSGRTPEGDILVARAHEKAREAMKSVRPELQIGITLSLHDIQTQPGGEAPARTEWEEDFLHYLPYLQKDDFLGVQNYTRKRMGQEGVIPPEEDAELTQMNYEFYPQAIDNVTRFVASHWKKPIIITENGVATLDDTRRVAFIQQALAGVQACLADGIDIKGYMYWSLLDNFEWQLGFTPKFGLIGVDRATQQRQPKESLRVLGGYSFPSV